MFFRSSCVTIVVIQLCSAINAYRSSCARRSRTAHDLYSGKICYRYHPRYGTAVQLIRYLRRVRLPINSQLAIPEWMLEPETCEELKIEARQRISMRALLDLRHNLTFHSGENGM